MNLSTQFNTLPLLTVKPGLDNLLGQVSRDLEIYFAAPETSREILQSAFVGFHRIGDMLQALSLDGVSAFCGEIEAGLQEFLSGMLPPSPVYRSAFQNALFALAHYLDALADGASKPALCLFPQYQALQQARGMEMAFEVELFFPDLQVDLPPSVLTQPPGDAPQAHIKTERGKYQTALLRWMRQDNPIEALQSMRSAVQTAMGSVPQNQERAFWWVASALLDCMIYQGQPPGQDARKLLSWIDLQMKLLTDGQLADPKDSLREMLYWIARSDEVSNTVSEVKRVYGLEKYLPQANALRADETEPVPGLPAMQQHAAQDDVDEHLLPVFLEEADDIFPHVGGNMRAWRERPEDKALGRSLHRRLHTLKGSARMAGAMHVGDLTHRMEECVVQAMAQTQPDMAAHDELEDYFDRIGNALKQLRNESRLADQAAVGVVAQQELAHLVNEGAHNVATLQQAPLKNLDETSRMLPFTSIGERLHRIVRQTSRELNKKARLELRGDGVELDRRVLDRITAPLEHMLRNAIAHGLETPSQREHMGKPPIGVISLSLRQEGNEVIFELSDDGAGINLARLRQKAMELGMLQPGENASDEQVRQLIFTPGVTTATEVTEVSGRGIGMDVVRSEITALGGRIEVFSKEGEETRFISHLPLTLTSTQALPVRAGQAAHFVEHGRTSDATRLMNP